MQLIFFCCCSEIAVLTCLRAALRRRIWKWWLMNVSCQCVLAAQKAKCILGYIKRSVTSRWREVILLLWAPTWSTASSSGAPTQGHWAVGSDPEESHEDEQRAGAPLLWGQAERAGVLQPREEKAVRWPDSDLPVSEGGTQESWEGTFYKCV